MSNPFPPVTPELIRRVRNARTFNRMEVLQNLADNLYQVDFRTFGDAIAFKVLHSSLRSKSRLENLTEADIEKLDEAISFYRFDGISCQIPVPTINFTKTFSQSLINHGFVPAFQTVTLYGVPEICFSQFDTNVIVEETNDIEFYLDIFIKANGIKPADEAAVRDLELSEYQEPGMKFFIAYLNQKAVGVGSLCNTEKIGFLVDAATLPEFRRCGCQYALIKARFQAAKLANCDLTVVGTMLFSPSHRNLESIGMKILDISTTWIDTRV